MTAEFDEALGRWETGELSRDELSRRFPEEDITGVLGMFERMQAAATGPTPDPAVVWEGLRGQLPVRLAHRRKRSRGISLLAAALVALLALGATAYAFVPGVRRAVSAAFDPAISTGEAPDRTVEIGDRIEPIDSTGAEPDPDDAVADEDEKASPATDPDEDVESQDQEEDQTGNDQGQDEDEGTGSEQGSGDDGTTGGDQGQGTQGAGSQEGSDGTAQDGVDQGDNDANQPDQPGDENSGD